MRRTLKKGAIWLHVGRRKGFDVDVMGRNFVLSTGAEPTVEIDLTGNLRTRNKMENSYLDAVELQREGLESVASITFDDRWISDRLRAWLPAVRGGPAPVKLVLHLDCAYSRAATLRLEGSQASFDLD